MSLHYLFAQLNLKVLPQATAGNDKIQAALQIMFGLAGAIAVLVITISGFRYIVAAGDPQATAKAKKGIIYSLVGLTVCILAEGIVTFVIGNS